MIDFSSFEKDLTQKLQGLLAYPGFKGQTSNRFLGDLTRIILEKGTAGAPVIEVGCYLGKSTFALALICEAVGSPLFSIDVNQANINFAANLLADSGVSKEVFFFHGDFPTFASNLLMPRAPSMVLIDAHHGYRYVRADIDALFALNRLPRFAAFHDYALRRIGEKTDDAPDVYGAIHDSFASFSPIPVGIVGPSGPPKVNDRGNYMAEGVSEGIVIELESARYRPAAEIAARSSRGGESGPVQRLEGN